MNIEEYREYCLSLPYTTESTPFDETTLVMKVGGKMYAYTDMIDFTMITVKCQTEIIDELREQNPDIIPGYYANKRHWNSLKTNGNLTNEEIKHWIKNSYDLVVAKLPTRVKAELESQNIKKI